MNAKKIQLTIAGFLHDIGKLILRANLAEQRQDHSMAGATLLNPILEKYDGHQSILDCVRCHHAKALENSGLLPDHPAWIVYEADNIAAGTDRRAKPTEGDYAQIGKAFLPSKCLDNVFNLVRTPRNNSDSHQEYRLVSGAEEEKRYINPIQSSTDNHAGANEYARIWQDMQFALKAIDWGNPLFLNSIYNILEGFTSYVPSSTDTSQAADISLFDHSVLTAGIASCIYDWADEQGITDYKELCFTNAKSLRQQNVFIIAHADLSGIQNFLYTISSKRALKSLRGRSFYLELILEQIADEILSTLDLTRANLLYAGGGGFYLLLPNTNRVCETLERARNTINKWLLDQFSINLYLGLAWSPAAADTFMENRGAEVHGTSEIFRRVAHQLSIQKLQRYHDFDLDQIFEPQHPEHGDRECVVCGQSGRLTKPDHDSAENADQICTTCQGLINLGSQLISDRGICFCVQREKPKHGLQLPLPVINGEAWLAILSEEAVRQILRDKPDIISRIYTKNHRASGADVSTRLWVGDYNYCAIHDKGAVEFEDFIKLRGGQGIERVAVLRADVDNLGSLFAGGFRGDAPDKAVYETLGRYAALSRSLSRFFKNHINHIARETEKNMVIVYSGGDDLFAVGAWDEIVDFALDLREKFAQFSGDKLSFSAGIGFFRHDYPVARMAEMTGDLEQEAKKGRKDQVALFGINSRAGLPECRHVYSWKRLKDGVLPKRDFLMDQLIPPGHGDLAENRAAGKSFLYKVYDLLLAADDSLSLARLAYLIARREPSNKDNSQAQIRYQELRTRLYAWATDPEERRELITAIMLCIYALRKRGE